MQQQETTNKQKHQNREVTVVLVALFLVLVCLVTLSQESRYLDMHTQKLILTEQGCSDIASLGLQPRREASGCSIIARYSPGFLGSDRTILRDDDRFVTLSSAAVLANADTNEILPDTPKQQRVHHILWGIYAVIITLWIVMSYVTFKPNKSEKKGNES